MIGLVKSLVAILMLLFPICAVMAQGKSPASAGGAQADQLQSFSDWLQDNLDDDVFSALNDIDHEKVRKVFDGLQKGFDGTNVTDLAALKGAASEVVPLLKEYEETYPFGVWMQTHLDYLEAAEKMQKKMRLTSPKDSTALLPKAPPFALQRQVWVEELKQRPWPQLAKNYVPDLKKIFYHENVPTELVWIAEVESSFDPEARSPAGAAGMFQLMPITAKGQKLSLFPFDERLHPEKSARASAQYLRHLWNRFGDWQLALAAYNAGETRVEKLLKQSKVRSYEAIASRLPAETQMYVPKIEATLRIREGVTFEDLKMPVPKS